MKDLKDLKFPELKRDQLIRIKAGDSVDGVPVGGGFYNPNDESGEESNPYGN